MVQKASFVCARKVPYPSMKCESDHPEAVLYNLICCFPLTRPVAATWTTLTIAAAAVCDLHVGLSQLTSYTLNESFT